MLHLLSTELTLALLILSLGIDTLTVAVGIGIATSKTDKKHHFRVACSFALFEGLMPLIGFFLGHLLTGIIGDSIALLGLLVLFVIGVLIIKGALTPNKNDNIAISSWRGLFITSLSISLDELAVGFSMGALGLPIVATVIFVALQAFVFTLIGTTLGNRIGEKLSEKAELIAGGVLCLLALILILEKIHI